MTLIRTGLLNAVAVAVRLLSMLVLNKTLALEVGPAGYGLIGQLQNAVTTITAIASAGVNTGVTKYTAEYHEDAANQRQVWATAGFLGLVCSLIVGFVIVVFRAELAIKLFKDAAYSDVFVWVAACLVLYVFNAFLLAIINGLKEIELFVVANIANSLIALAVTGVLASMYGLHGALIALAINQSIACVATVALARKRIWFRLNDFFGRPDWAVTRKLSQFTLMAIATSVLGPLTLIAVRNILIAESGIEASGYWEAMTRISSLYLMFISMPLSVYYLPKLSELTNAIDLRRELTSGLKMLIPVTASMALAIYLLREFIIELLFSAEFAPMAALFAWQLTGDIVRVTAWLFSFFLISRAMTKQFLFAEIVAALSFVTLALVLIRQFGTEGVAIAYALNNFFYLGVLLFLVRLILYDRKKDKFT